MSSIVRPGRLQSLLCVRAPRPRRPQPGRTPRQLRAALLLLLLMLLLVRHARSVLLHCARAAMRLRLQLG